MNELKTISQIARELNVSRQAIYSKLKSPDIKSVMCQYTVRHNNRTLYTSDFVNVLKQAFESVNTVQTLDTICQDEVSTTIQSQLDVLKAENNSLRDKIADRDKTIERLEQDKAKLNERLDKAETNISNLTTALTAAQALHGMDKQQAVIEVDAAPTKEQASADQTPTPQEPQQKLSLFARLFRKRSE